MHRPTDDLATIPESYSTELQVVFNALRDMDWPGEVTYLHGMAGIGLGIADSLMFQRGDPSRAIRTCRRSMGWQCHW